MVSDERHERRVLLRAARELADTYLRDENDPLGDAPNAWYEQVPEDERDPRYDPESTDIASADLAESAAWSTAFAHRPSPAHGVTAMRTARCGQCGKTFRAKPCGFAHAQIGRWWPAKGRR